MYWLKGTLAKIINCGILDYLIPKIFPLFICIISREFRLPVGNKLDFCSGYHYLILSYFSYAFIYYHSACPSWFNSRLFWYYLLLLLPPHIPVFTWQCPNILELVCYLTPSQHDHSTTADLLVTSPGYYSYLVISYRSSIWILYPF